MARIVVAMSGGVDSSVAALLCIREGHSVVGATIALGQVEKAGPDVAEAAAVAAILGIPHHVFDFAAQFQRIVVDRFCGEYMRGQTPNPCVVCNPEIKFGLLLTEATALGADYLATGHYVRLGRSESGRLTLLRATDGAKDQSYTLYRLTQAQLGKSRFPLGGLTKSEARALASEAGLPVADRPESQDLCFAVSSDYRAMLNQAAVDGAAEGLDPGPILDASGRVIGRHEGIANYTVGQRKGLGLTSREPLYVLAIRPAERAVVVGPVESTYSHGLTASDCSWMAIDGLGSGPVRAEVKIRYSSRPAWATVTQAAQPGCVEVLFDTPQRSVTPGQAAVFYSGDELLGGGTIDHPIPD